MTSDVQLTIIFLGILCVWCVGNMFKTFARPVLLDRYAVYKKKKYERKFKTQAIGEVVGSKRELRHDFLTFSMERRRRAWEESAYFAYSPIVKYTVDGCAYEINVDEYTMIEPEMGQRVLVVYNPNNPADACARIERTIFQDLGEGEEWKRLETEERD